MKNIDLRSKIRASHNTMRPSDRRESGWGYSLSTKAEEAIEWLLWRWETISKEGEEKPGTPLWIYIPKGETGRTACWGPVWKEEPFRSKLLSVRTGEEFLRRLDKIYSENAQEMRENVK